MRNGTSAMVGSALAGAAGISVVGALVWSFGMYWEPVPSPLPGRIIKTLTVPRGGLMVVGSARVAGNKCLGWIYRQIIDAHDDLIFYETEFRPPTQIPLPVNSVRRFPIPAYASLGTAHYDVTIQWSCNFVQRMFPVFEVLPTLDFEIVDSPKVQKK